MTDVDRLIRCFESGELVRPDASAPNIVDLANAVAHLCGAAVDLTENSQLIAERIGPADHIVFVLADGLGMHLLDRLPQNGPLRRSFVMELRTVFPSSTAPALTSLATGAWPADHAVPGWWTHIPDASLTATILPFVERFSERRLSELGVSPGVAFPHQVLRATFSRRSLWISPRAISDSTYSRYSSADADAVAYDSLQLAVERIVRQVEQAAEPTYSYLYVPFVDTAEHEHGPASGIVTRTLRDVCARLDELIARLNGRARVIITADHGQIDADADSRVIIDRGDPLMAMLQHPPTCEPRATALHVRGGLERRFADAFRERFSERFLLLGIAEVEELRLLGPGPLSRETRRRLGDFLALPLGRGAFLFEPSNELRAMKGFHGGMLPEEVQIPLVVA
jgi:hypothetical protein